MLDLQTSELAIAVASRNLESAPLTVREVQVLYKYLRSTRTNNPFILDMQRKIGNPLVSPQLTTRQLNVVARIMSEAFIAHLARNGQTVQYTATGTLSLVSAVTTAIAVNVATLPTVAPIVHGKVFAAVNEALVTTYDVPDRYKGRYTVNLDGGDITVRIRPRIVDPGNEPYRYMGKVQVMTIGYLYSADNTRDYRDVGCITDDGCVYLYKDHRGNDRMRAAMICLGASEALRVQYGCAYAVASSCCYRCNRDLTVKSSIDAGLGPICARKVYGN